MSVIRFSTTSKGNLPHLYYIFRKMEPLGMDFNTVDCSVTGYLVLLDIQQGKGGTKSSWYHLELVATAACTKILMEETKGMGQRALKRSTCDCFLFYSWFFSKKVSEVVASIGVDLIGMVKTNTNRFCKATVEVLTKDLPGIS